MASAKEGQFSGDTGLADRDEGLILRDVSTFEGPIAGALSDHDLMRHGKMDSCVTVLAFRICIEWSGNSSRPNIYTWS